MTNTTHMLVDEIEDILDFTRDKLFDVIAGLPQTNDVKELPSDSGLYFFMDHVTDEILYIGQSVDIKSRWQGRRDFLPGGERQVHYLLNWQKGYKLYDKDALEAITIFLFRPKFNQRFRGKVNHDIER